jgi:hypothetical protein
VALTVDCGAESNHDGSIFTLAVGNWFIVRGELPTGESCFLTILVSRSTLEHLARSARRISENYLLVEVD